MADAVPHSELTYKIIGAAMRVHRQTARGLREKHYQTALTTELLAAGLSVTEEYHREIHMGDQWLGRLYIDHWVNESVVVEDKAVSYPLGADEMAQAITYLAALDAKVGLLLDFGRYRLEYHRILPPKSRQGWQTHIVKYLWRPPGSPD